MEKRYKGILAVIFFFLLIAVATACNHEGDNLDVTAWESRHPRVGRK